MENPIKLTEKYERNGWPSLKRTDLKPPAGLTLPLLTSLERVRSHMLSPQGQIACIKDSETSSDVFTLSANGGWLARISTDRTLAPSWDDEIPQWSPDGKWLAFGLSGHVQSFRMTAACRKNLQTLHCCKRSALDA
jgi:Tol biopolymer transport system component